LDEDIVTDVAALPSGGDVVTTPVSVDDEEYSMLTVDSTGIDSVDLVARDSLGDDISDQLSWTTTDSGVATMSGATVVTVGAGSCQAHPVGYPALACDLTVFATFPTMDALKSLPGGKTDTTFLFDNAFSDDLGGGYDLRNMLYVGRTIRTGGAVGPVTRTYFKGADSTFVDAGSSTGAITVSRYSVASNGAYTGTQNNTITTGLIPSGTGFDFEIYATNSAVELNSTNYSTSVTANPSGTVSGRLVGDFVNGRAEKLRYVASAPNGTTMTAMKTPSSCRLAHCYQCWNKKTDGTTVIPNMGSMGRSKDMSNAAVPAAWFGV
jgi:hypothetical protein